MGILICQGQPGFGASVNGKVFDNNDNSYGCLEVRSPISRARISVEEGSTKNPFVWLKLIMEQFI